ncbi:PAS domain-containing sensor histidine kinase [uncultured Cohaesibacter sp.]|uniref:PAS domain-containing sensor histidine kinase n=1 Tax=uncultured Cohaesibacter sp. TaxID=1002546 RepID=UPI0029C8B350|nr:PAS domain-containing sensor histidine kinase [uncultured Cohaesibacter sp.]
MQDAFWSKIPFQSVIEGLLHNSGQISKEDRQRHTLFVALHLLVGLMALGTLPLFLLLSHSGASEPASSIFLLPVWMLAPLVSVAYLSRTGSLSGAFLLTASLTAAFLVWVASLTGGLLSPHLIWLGVIPLEVALSGNSRIAKQSLMICVVALASIGLLQFTLWQGNAPSNDLLTGIIGSLSVMAAVLYAGLLALRLERLTIHRPSPVALEEIGYRGQAFELSDVITHHDRSGDVTFVSPASRRLFDIAPEELVDNQLFQHIHIQDRPAYLRALSDCMNQNAGQNRVVNAELRILTPVRGQVGGTQLRWVEFKCIPERDENGSVVGAIATTRDISTRKNHQAALEEARIEAEKANEGKTRFLANVTHELRTPLNTIIGFSEILSHPELSKDNEERNREYAALIHNGGHHLLQLVNALLDMSRLESGNFEINPQNFNMCDLTQSCCKMMQAEADRREITLFNECEKSIPEFNIDPRACRQILLNLISNALKFSDEGDQVKVTLKWASAKEGRAKGQWVELSVRDTGIGIDKKDIAKLGTPFMQAETSLNRRYEGAGIGLSIVRGLAELQKGSMRIESERGAGTCVTILLPVDMEAVSDEEIKLTPNSLVKIEQQANQPVEQTLPSSDTKVA